MNAPSHSHQQWRHEHVGMVRYQSYWHKYCLVLHVDEDTQLVTELDAFAEMAHPPSSAKIRTHATLPDRNDRFLTVAEYYDEVISKRPDTGEE